MIKPAMITKSPAAILALFLLLSVGLSCRMIESMGGGEKAGTVSELWPDVPPFTGATKSDLQIPLGARLILRVAMQGKISFIAYNDQERSGSQDFYTVDMMKSAGWTAHDKGLRRRYRRSKNQGVVCMFERKDGDKREGLAIITAEDTKTKLTNIFYARIDMTQPTPSPSR